MSEWIDYELQDVAKVQVSNVDKKSYAGQKIIALCNYMDVYSNHYITPEIDFMVATASAEEIEKFKVKCGDVIITKDSETPFDIGISAAVTAEIDDLICGYHLAQLRPQPDKINSIFLAKTLSSDRSKKYFAAHSAGSTRYGLSNRSIQRVPLSLPSLNHQKKIAAILETVDLAIEQTEALIAKYEQVKAGMMQDLFTRGLTSEGKLRPTRQQAPNQYQKTPIGWIPKEWELHDLSAVANVIDPNPSHRNPVYHEAGFPFISTVEFTEPDSILTDTSRRVIEEIVVEQERRCDFSTNSIAFSRKGTIGETRFLPSYLRFALLDSLCVINAKTISSGMLFHSLRSAHLKRQIKNMTMGQALPQMSIGRVRALKVPVPIEPNEQNELAERLESISRKTEAEFDQLQKLRQQKSGLMHDLLTGKVEVKV